MLTRELTLSSMSGFSIAAIISAALFATPANAEFYNGNDLKRMCDTNSTSCPRYITGVVDDTLWRQDVVGAKTVFCIPSGTEVGQIVDLVKLYLEANPEKRHWPAALLIVNAMQKSYLCNKKT